MGPYNCAWIPDLPYLCSRQQEIADLRAKLEEATNRESRLGLRVRDLYHDLAQAEARAQEAESRVAKLGALRDDELEDRIRIETRARRLEEALRAIGQAWDAFDEKVIRPVEGGFRIVDSPEAWQAYHKVDSLIADWQLRDAPQESPPSVAEGT